MKQLLSNGFYLTDGGMETTLVFHEGVELNHFAAFELMLDGEGRARIRRYFRQYLEMAGNYHSNFILETPTWRANSDWGYKLGYSKEELRQINFDSVQFLKELKNDYEPGSGHILISGCLGPRGDGYQPGKTMTSEESANYHQDQINALAVAGADLVSAFTMNYTNEAIGIARAAKKENIPVVISFTLETDGHLPGGESLRHAIETTDSLSDNYVSYYMINCAHPEHFIKELQEEGKWKHRIAAIRANASTKSHAELDESETLDTGDCLKLAESYDNLWNMLPGLKVAGGCCGTDLNHIQAIAEKLLKKATSKAIKHALLLLILLFTNVFNGYTQDSEKRNRLSAGIGLGKNTRQDLIFSPLIHSSSSLMNGLFEYSRDGKLYQQATLKLATFSPMNGEPWKYTENGKLKTAERHNFTYVDVDYSLGKKYRILDIADIFAGGSFLTAMQSLNYFYGRIGNFGYLSTLNLGFFGKIDFAISEKSALSITVKLPVITWLARSPYLVNDDEFIENISSHSAIKSFLSFLKDGRFTSWKNFQYINLAASYFYELHQHWDIGISWFYKYIHSSFPRNLVSEDNTITISAILKF